MLKDLDTIEGLTEDQIAGINGLTKGLIDKKVDLEQKLRNSKTSASENESAQEKLQVLEAGIERERLESKENYQGALTLKEKEYQTNLDKMTNDNAGKDTLIHSLLVDQGLSTELMKYDVNKDLMGRIQKGLSSEATIVDGKAMFGEQSLSDYIKEWAETPEGKASRTAPANSGGDGQGGAGSGGGKKMVEMNGAERTALFKSNPEEFNRLKSEM